MKRGDRSETMGEIRNFMDQPLRVWLDQLIQEMRAQREEGHHPGLVFLLE